MSGMALVFFWSSVCAAGVSTFGVLDAWKTLVALNDSDRAWDVNARVLARGGIRTAFIRTLQMVGLLIIAEVAVHIHPRPENQTKLETSWVLLAVVCWLSIAKELWAMWDRRHIVPDVHPPEGWRA